MKPFPIVKELNVLKDTVISLLPCSIAFMERPFGLRGVKKAFDNRVVPAVSLVAHRAGRLMFDQVGSDLVRCVLSASIGMKRQSRFWLSGFDSLFQGLFNRPEVVQPTVFREWRSIGTIGLRGFEYKSYPRPKPRFSDWD